MSTADTNPKGRVLNMKEIAEMTRIPQGTLRYYRHQRRGPVLFKQGRCLVAYEADVRAWMAEQYAAGREHYASAQASS
ncbi:hypothetical protein GCM10009530_63120 [Microbispora corallina]|uniref:Helix-turn-helix domain-containing protein n=1 Tax=Microbispora corallina TaxID=83302 RepID=A0ABQ4GBL4_9ACTN|nr:helix-turn-helix domain-containing protein [Microbispora corallina]GIH44458.1 hypothetical protein Mco01_74580 [Microbispora corallina]